MSWTRLHTRCAIVLTVAAGAWLYWCMQEPASLLRHYDAMDSYWHDVAYVAPFAAAPVIVAWFVTLASPQGSHAEPRGGWWRAGGAGRAGMILRVLKRRCVRSAGGT